MKAVQFQKENIGRAMIGDTTDKLKKIELIEGKIDDKLVLDTACGPGRFVDTSLLFGTG